MNEEQRKEMIADAAINLTNEHHPADLMETIVQISIGSELNALNKKHLSAISTFLKQLCLAE